MNHILAIAALILLPTIVHAHLPIDGASKSDKVLCQFAPENDLQIPVNSFLANSEMTEERFNEILDHIHKVYEPTFSALGKTFEIERLWENSANNARAKQKGNVWKIKMYGGLARHPKMTADGFALVACHEIGHHLGGAPKKTKLVIVKTETPKNPEEKPGEKNEKASYTDIIKTNMEIKLKKLWASNEGQSDYFASLKCARQIWDLKGDKQPKFTIDPVVKSKCGEAFPDSPEEQTHCQRVAMAGMSLAQVLNDIVKGKRNPAPPKNRGTIPAGKKAKGKIPGPKSKDEKFAEEDPKKRSKDSSEPSFSTPDTRKVKRTFDGHPKAQCRLDTYFAGAICNADKNKELDDNDPDKGTCSRKYGDALGVRPLCWFKPNSPPQK